MLLINYTTGYAGTGKSHALLELIATLPLETVVIAPTHKALHRLTSKVGKSHVEFKTIHSLLGWIPRINEEATTIGGISSTVRLDKPLESYKHIVIDEAGMMSEDMLYDLTSKIEELLDGTENKLTLHLFLDPYQLLPVKGRQIQVDENTTTHLTTQHRGESPDVVALFTKFVDFIESGGKTKDLTTPESENVLHINREQLVAEFKEGDRVLAYTNNCVGGYNEVIAKHLGYDSMEGREVQIGNFTELIVPTFVEPTYEELYALWDDRILQMQDNRMNSKFVQSSLEALLKHKEIKFVDIGEKVLPVILGVGKAHRLRQEASKKALGNKKAFKEVYTLGRAYTMDYPFATTVHKSQGSEFGRVMIDKADIMKSIMNGYYMNYARLMYVALSRAKNKVYLRIH